ncbi:MAG: 50S ribosomal protein L11 methyltransferase [Pseudomonadota bacterium]
MPWLQITLETRAADAEHLAEALHEAGAAAVTLQDAADQPLFQLEPGDSPLWTNTHVIGLFTADCDPTEILAQLQSGTEHTQPLRTLVTTLPDQDWERSWMDQFHPIRFGERLWVCPRWHTPPDPTAVNVMLDPGLAFGTGTHATTALCLEWLDGEDLADQTVLDFGCGSGILAIAAAKLGAAEVWAVDHDPQALLATRDNAEVNGVEKIITVCGAENLTAIHADVVLANILAAPLIALAPRFARLLPPGGRVVLSGILAEQAEEVLENYRAWFTMATITVREGWVRAHGRRNQTPAA